MPNADNFQPFTASGVMGAGDATKEIVAAQVGKQLVVTRGTVIILTSAAQTVDVESGDGAVELMKLAVSAAVNTQYYFSSRQGFAFPVNTNLRVQPSAAGVSLFYAWEGYIKGYPPGI